jgi:Flp pilus assembly protein TadG
MRSPHSGRSRPSRRRGSVVVLAAVLMVIMLAMVAFSLDIGMICVAKSELQRSADAAALAATDELLYRITVQGGLDAQKLAANKPGIQTAAVEFAGLNLVATESPLVDHNFDNAASGEIVVGEMVRDGAGKAQLDLSDISQYNSVGVRVQRTSNRNGEISLFFGRVLGRNSTAVEAYAQAAFIQDFRGFRIPTGPTDPPPTLMILPIAVRKADWDASQSGVGIDQLGWDAEGERVVSTGDGIPEISLFPTDVGAPGNFGLVDIGSANSTTGTLSRQIEQGATKEDLEFHGGELSLGDDGTLTLSGDPGQKLGAIEPALKSIIGENRIVPLYESVSEGGNGAQYKIVGFAGGRIMDVELTGSTRYVKMQSGPMITRGGIPGGSHTSSGIFSPVRLVR